MALIVQKFGGTSVANIEKIKNVAKRVAKTVDKGHRVAVVVSAMAGETDRLINLAMSASPNPVMREYDVVISTGEQVSVGLLAIVLNEMGYRAKSYLGFQIPIKTDNVFSKARILEINAEKLMKDINDGFIPVISGFQGITEDGDITTLGRGGSDTSAVAVAAALKADVCEIYTDVEGVFTTDPNVYDKAKKIDRISYEEMLELASLGAKVLMHRSVELAMKYNVPVHVRSTFSENEGTWVIKEDETMEKRVVTAVTYDKKEAKITVVRVPDRPGIAAQIFTPLSEQNILVDMIIQNASIDGYTDLTFTVPKTELKKAFEIVKKVAKEIGATDVKKDENIAKVSIVGIGMRSHSGVAAKMFETLARENINILMISTSEIKISCVIEEKYTELAVRVLHDAFGLSGNQ